MCKKIECKTVGRGVSAQLMIDVERGKALP